jgi:hypothetical protein
MGESKTWWPWTTLGTCVAKAERSTTLPSGPIKGLRRVRSAKLGPCTWLTLRFVLVRVCCKLLLCDFGGGIICAYMRGDCFAGVSTFSAGQSAGTKYFFQSSLATDLPLLIVSGRDFMVGGASRAAENTQSGTLPGRKRTITNFAFGLFFLFFSFSSLLLFLVLLLVEIPDQAEHMGVNEAGGT